MRFIFKITIIFLIYQSFSFGIGTQFLAIPANSNEMVFDINPTLINANRVRPIISMSYGNWLADIRLSSLSYQRQAFGGTTGLQFRYVALNDLELRQDRPTDEPLAEFGATAIALGGYHQRNINNIEFLLAARYINIRLFDEKSDGFAIDLGVNYPLTEKLNLGVEVLNLGAMSELNESKPKLPLRLIFGAKYNLKFDNIYNSILLAIEKSSQVNSVIINVGDELKWNKLTFQLGAQYSNNVIQVSSGVGIRLGAYRIAYGVQIGTQQLGIPQMLDVTLFLP